MHTIFLRFHNLVAKKLKLLNPHWTSNKIYLETRRILGAITQHITYNDWLPRVIGHSNMLYYGLYSTTPGQETRYVYYDTADPSMLNEFTTAAFRFAHSAVLLISLSFFNLNPLSPLFNLNLAYVIKKEPYSIF